MNRIDEWMSVAMQSYIGNWIDNYVRGDAIKRNESIYMSVVMRSKGMRIYMSVVMRSNGMSIIDMSLPPI